MLVIRNSLRMELFVLCLVFNLDYYKFVMLDVPTLLFCILISTTGMIHLNNALRTSQLAVCFHLEDQLVNTVEGNKYCLFIVTVMLHT